MLHEEDLPRFFSALSKQGGGFYTIDQCVMTRIKAGEAQDRSGQVKPNIAADCELAWVTAKPVPKQEKKG
jgi:hypothetical protein